MSLPPPSTPRVLRASRSRARTAPRGFTTDHPRIGLLRHKALIAGRRIAPGTDAIPRERTLVHTASTWRAAEPINARRDEHVGVQP